MLLEVLGKEFDSVLGCDYFSPYRKYMKDFGVAVQFCLTHLIREVQFLLTLPDKVTRNYAQRLLNALRKLFRRHPLPRPDDAGTIPASTGASPPSPAGGRPTGSGAAGSPAICPERAPEAQPAGSGTSESGRRSPRWTQQGRSILAYLRDAAHATFTNQSSPALLPAGP